ncbi:MAG: T9SS type A sorting domain-containing protein, partial [bacterium]|nr:T9SS type A sorting domain-containing protein [bacterium]
THSRVVEATLLEQESSTLPTKFSLDTPYPNPFNASMQVTFAVPEARQVRISVVDVQGRTIAELVQGTVSAGKHRIMWAPEGVTSGLYFVRMDATDWQAVRKVMYLR